jgi:transporter family-2 protein
VAAMVGILFSLLAGVFISLQGVFNTRLSDKIGFWETNSFVHGTGFLVSLIVLSILGKGHLGNLAKVNKLYMLGGVFGVVIVFSVMKGISVLGATFSVAILLITQLIVSTIIDSFGLFGSPQIKFDITKFAGLAIMIAGIIVFKIKG